MRNYPDGMSRADLIHVDELGGGYCENCPCEERENPENGVWGGNEHDEWVTCSDWPKPCAGRDLGLECEPCECECHAEPDDPSWGDPPEPDDFDPDSGR